MAIGPADRLTKHSLTCDRVEGFTKLYDCYFRDGRAESAPAMRTGETQKQTIAKANKTETLNSLGRRSLTTTTTTTEPAKTGDEQLCAVPRMPHNIFRKNNWTKNTQVWRP